MLGTARLARLSGGAWKPGMPKPQPAGRATAAASGDRGFVVPELNAHALRKLAGASQYSFS